MARLIAKRPILHLATQYKAGEELPQDDQEMVKLWIKYESAAYEGKQVNSPEGQQEDEEVEQKEDKKTEKKSSKSKKEAH